MWKKLSSTSSLTHQIVSSEISKETMTLNQKQIFENKEMNGEDICWRIFLVAVERAQLHDFNISIFCVSFLVSGIIPICVYTKITGDQLISPIT